MHEGALNECTIYNWETNRISPSLDHISKINSSVPSGLKPILGSGLIIGASLAIILNFIFRIGVSQSSKLILDEPNVAQQAARFLEDCGAAWSARRDVITSAGMAVGEVLETLFEARLIKAPIAVHSRF